MVCTDSIKARRLPEVPMFHLKETGQRPTMTYVIEEFWIPSPSLFKSPIDDIGDSLRRPNFLRARWSL
jgi:hypothetical protein